LAVLNGAFPVSIVEPLVVTIRALADITCGGNKRVIVLLQFIVLVENFVADIADIGVSY
jgi:hypothetical protein